MPSPESFPSPLDPSAYAGIDLGARVPLPLERALHWGMARLGGAADRPRLEAERLLAAVLQVERPVLIAHPELMLRPAQVRAYMDAVQRRQHGTPLPYILGRIEFFGLEFIVTPDVLIPRPETELLVEHALDHLNASRLAGKRPLVVDVGAGSGCISIALAVLQPALRVIAIDIDASALAVARANGLRHAVGDRVRWVCADMLTAIAAPVDLLLSNPPYVAEGEWQELPDSVRQEPRLALLAGPDGLAAIRRLLQQARSRLSPGALMVVEIGSGQGGVVRDLARTVFPDAAVEIVPDFAGLDRLLKIHT